VIKRTSLKVAGFPKDMPDHIDINVAELDFHHAYKVGDIKVDGLTFLDTKTSPIAVVVVPRAAKDAAAAAEAEAAATSEAEEKKD
jgi:large subunit ribosomal protein L25